MVAIAFVLFLLALSFAPAAWVRYELARGQADRPDLPGTGGELARHLLDRFGLPDVRVEAVASGDHYDPIARVVRLETSRFDGRSISAVAIAAHEVGHALQHAGAEPGFEARARLVPLMVWLDRISLGVMLLAPVVFAITHAPHLLLAQIGLAIGLQLVTVGVHLVTLPVEFDASFGKALPVLADGYLGPEDLGAARRVLRAGALTYVAAAMASLVDITRLVRALV